MEKWKVEEGCNYEANRRVCIHGEIDYWYFLYFGIWILQLLFKQNDVCDLISFPSILLYSFWMCVIDILIWFQINQLKFVAIFFLNNSQIGRGSFHFCRVHVKWTKFAESHGLSSTNEEEWNDDTYGGVWGKMIIWDGTLPLIKWHVLHEFELNPNLIFDSENPSMLYGIFRGYFSFYCNFRM